ncbi:unnamed protein product [Caenorhabditis bovis]|uniref:FAD/NAD(P)-binding domain-containing protein n=1 Tax=Caenorhabditis bovis TaxID=2654633 RepID=A0A8S1F0K8_9PELO|nr:unnamed protein product [Caenorhabditis bovis]
MIFVVVGGGIAGVSCSLEILKHSMDAETQVILISASSHVKTVKNWYKIGQFTEHFDVGETNEPISNDNRLKIIFDTVTSFNPLEKCLSTGQSGEIRYDRLAIATGASPICPYKSKNVICIRDTDTVIKLEEKLKNAKKLAIIGNGGIATELVYELKNVNIVWLIRDSSISSAFFPAQLANFITSKLLKGRGENRKNSGILKRQIFTTSSLGPSGAALGPDWCTAVDLTGAGDQGQHNVEIIQNAKVANICETQSGLRVDYTAREAQHQIDCDFAVWATGVVPNSQIWAEHLEIAENHGIIVDDLFRTTIPDVFACGDVCTLRFPDSSPLWKQMYLWTQARQMGASCGLSMVIGEEARISNIHLDLFAHCTTFFGLKRLIINTEPTNYIN